MSARADFAGAPGADAMGITSLTSQRPAMMTD